MTGGSRLSSAGVALAGLFTLSACSMAPHYQRPAPPVPDAWPAGAAYPQDQPATAPALPFSSIFTDARLQQLVSQALATNRDVRVAAANVLAAQARADAQGAARLPQLGVGTGVTRRSGDTSGLGFIITRTNYTATAGISAFELDLFGRLASATAAQRNAALASASAAQVVRLSLVANLSTAWAAYGADAELLRLAQETAANARHTVSLTSARLQAGVAPRSDLRQAEELLAGAEADLAAQTTALAQDRNLIELLVGAPVDSGLLPDDLGSVIAGVRPLAAGQSSEVLLLRPDVMQAEYALRAANADVGAARGALFPRISLTGLFGFASASLSSLFAKSAETTTTGGSINYPLFAGGGARANLRVSRAQLQAAVASYEGAIQIAFREVADALARQGTISDQLTAVTRQSEASSDTAQLVEARYRGGVASALDNLVAQRNQYAARRQLVATRLALVTNRVQLFRALGGDPAADARDAGAKRP
ncbi:efflux transporter outer membrane subunit [Novosphingobium piscinae]|uniref:Efflux transporter outer membrane subunit n=1 Tax=Novosphingobium piscinae TaxID=1507448 RepID=A0A7X1G024_9SPHN|nr:efflux transporter outer membrane subunit [Novosphingobium piscinae]MBC2669502.1 efflux transporter outer membrane subunit [Novosphingobium piscinae]